MNEGCGCCACLAGAGEHIGIDNRPGLSALHYRAGTYDTMLAAMLRRLSMTPSLQALTTREHDDPAIAFLDAWATTGDVLTFYQERIANEGYLRTAIERRSILELGRLAGYRMKPGVAATVYLAYTIDEKTSTTTIPAGSKVQSTPGADEKPQTFETSDTIEARGAWSALKPRLSEPQAIEAGKHETTLWLAGANTRLEAGDVLLFTFTGNTFELRQVTSVTPHHHVDKLEIVSTLMSSGASKELPESAMTRSAPKSKKKKKAAARDIAVLETTVEEPGVLSTSDRPTFFDELALPAAVPPAGQHDLHQSLGSLLSAGSDFAPLLVGTFKPAISQLVYNALRNVSRTRGGTFLDAFVFRRKANRFGYNAPVNLVAKQEGNSTKVVEVAQTVSSLEADDLVWLDTPDDKVIAGSWVAVIAGGSKPEDSPLAAVVSKVKSADLRTRADYGISSKSTRIQLDDNSGLKKPATFDSLRGTVIYAESEKLTLAEQPVTTLVGRPQIETEPTKLDLGVLLDGFKPGRWVIVTGERADLTASVVTATELAMVAAVQHVLSPPNGGSPYSILILAPKGLAYRYRRDSVTIYGNVVKATHGETRSEILGGGDASQSMQTFTLHNPPLTFVPAPTPDGAASTLVVRVNDVQWHELDSLAAAGPTDRVYVTKTSNDAKTSVVFGNGTAGSRIPTGSDNVRAVYRSGIGRGGNVRAAQITTAISRPLGIKDVVNPMPASGGADPESRDDARRNVPVALQAMGRVVSVRDYADFARTFAGIAKAVAVQLTDGRRQFVHLTIGGTADIDIDPTSDLYRNLVTALGKYGDPYLPFEVALREKLIVAGSANVRILPDYLWSSVYAKLRAALLDALSYDRRDFGQPVFPSEIVAVLQDVDGVDYVELTTLGPIAAGDITAKPGTLFTDIEIKDVQRIVPRLAHWSKTKKNFTAAQIAFLPPDLIDLFVLTEIK